MKVSFIIPLLDDYDIELAYKNIDKACHANNVEYNIVFALSNKLTSLFTKVRNVFSENNKIKAFLADRNTNEHKLITMAMQDSEEYDAVIIYSGKEETNVEVIKAFLSSWQAGNKIVYLKKVHRGFAKVIGFLKAISYKLGILALNIFKDPQCENDIQLLDADVVKTINQLPAKNQLLRTLDSLIYYAVDTIHLQVDPNEYINPIYNEKTKAYYKNAWISYGSLAIGLSTLLTSILLLSFRVKIGFLLHALFIGLFLMFGFISVIFNARKRLIVRVGEPIDLNELETIKQRTEYYNF